MSLNFASPWYLFGLLGIALPILVHMLTRRQQRRVPFSAVYLLEQAQKRSIRRSRPNRLLLLLLRCLAIAFLSLALANPLFSMTGTDQFLPSRPAATVFVLDDSYSMSMQGRESTLFDTAREVAAGLADRLPANNSFSLVLASRPASVALDWTQERDTFEKFLKTLSPSAQTTSIGQAMTRAQDLLSRAKQDLKRIFVLTDRDLNGWERDEFPSPPADPLLYSVEIIDVSGMQEGVNRALVEKIDLRQKFLTNRRLIHVKATVANLLSERPLKQLRISLRAGGKTIDEDVLDVPANGHAEKEFNFPYFGSDPISGYVEIEEDALNIDNRRVFSYQPDQRIKVLMVDGDPHGVSHQNETFYLEKALNPFSAAISDIEPSVSTLAELPSRNLEQFSVVMLCNVRELPIGFENEIEKYVLNGGALFVALGDQVDTKYYNEKLGILLPVALRALNQVGKDSEPFRLELEPSDHPVLEVFRGKTLEEMGKIEFHTLFSVEPQPDRLFRVPMRFSNHYPAVVEADFGKGKVILYTSSIDRDWNTFPIHPTFLPWIQRWVKYSARSLENIHQQNLLVGEPFVLESTGDQATYIVSPGGRIFEAAAGNDGVVEFPETFTPGVYQVYLAPSSRNKGQGDSTTGPLELPDGARQSGTFTVNIDPRESRPGKIGDKEIMDLLAGVTVTFAMPDDALTEPTESGFHLATPFILLMVGMLFLEGWLVRRE